ncbi:RluA family pseudouridine synthase [Candidatus Profftella armatura]|uniref:Pseudouridine synthase n=1 Tax=Candidatus Profftella armatura TaxID=669502 RepID=S5R191_9PROT|nr:RluA family pseudouridine synthase [Candidatus Profftella armatura]AGS06977.1 ribosomal large subunit pseudouridine synthase C [Candidatus Profftella armatura]ALC96043.1 pseudouridine synthase [Candidatus Profftella armatura]QLK13875.1 RluA family pseudouridine synthase [Candidatus Profftella armatura]
MNILGLNNNITSSISIQKFIILEENIGQRIDNFLLRVCYKVPRGHIYKILRSGEVCINKNRINQTYRLKKNDIIEILHPIKIEKKIVSKIVNIKFKILLEDNYLLIIEKPSGIAVHGGSGISCGIIEQLRILRPKLKFLELVHRLDRDTSGILLLAKKRIALINLHEQMRSGYIDKRYLVLVNGNWINKRQHIKYSLHKYISKDGNRRVTVIENGGKASHTIFSLKCNYGKKYTLLEAELKTGRTHQIRVHLSKIGFSVVGDNKYGNFFLNKALKKSKNSFNRMFLHASQITFFHPKDRKITKLKSSLPLECKKFLENLLKK